jgi:poly(3-hydroxybutyrate) depolymerase
LLQDHDVYITDWLDAKHVPLAKGKFGFDDYVQWVIDCIQHLGKGISVVSVCQPTVPVLCAIALMAERKDPYRPKSMIMMGGPIDTRKHPSQVNEFATDHSHEWFKKNLIATVPSNYEGSGRRVYPGFLQHHGFVAMNPQRHLKAHLTFFNDLIRGSEIEAEQHRAFYDEYNAVMDMPADYYLETIDRVFQEYHLATGKMLIKGQKVNPSTIKDIALFTIEGEHDDISCPGQTEAAHTLCDNIPEAKRDHLLAPGVGHYGIFAGSKFRSQIYPRMKAFIAKHC